MRLTAVYEPHIFTVWGGRHCTSRGATQGLHLGFRVSKQGLQAYYYYKTGFVVTRGGGVPWFSWFEGKIQL